MSYPSQRWPLDLSGFGVNGNGKGEGGLTVSFVSEEEEKDFVKKYMLDTFYRTAPVPRTIGLVKREFLILVLHQAFLFSFSKTQTETLEQGQPFLDEEIGTRLPHIKYFFKKMFQTFYASIVQDSMLESGLCQVVRDGGEGGEVLGAAIHCGWERDPVCNTNNFANRKNI